MKMLLACVVLVAIALALPLFGQNKVTRADGAVYATVEPKVRFVPLHITLDPQGAALAAYQFELKTLSGRVKIVGVEGGAHASFSRPPYYDAQALMQDRVVIAAFSTEAVLPTVSTRVVTLHLRVLGDGEPQFEVDVLVAANSQSHAVKVLVQHHLGEVQ